MIYPFFSVSMSTAAIAIRVPSFSRRVRRCRPPNAAETSPTNLRGRLQPRTTQHRARRIWKGIGPTFSCCCCCTRSKGCRSASSFPYPCCCKATKTSLTEIRYGRYTSRAAKTVRSPAGFVVTRATVRFFLGFVQFGVVAVHVETLVGAAGGRALRAQNRQTEDLARTDSISNR